MKNATQTTITQWIGNHQMTVMLDAGSNRHIRFQNPETSTHWFELVTFENGLLLHGDFGNYSFRKNHVADMFSFFRGRENDSEYVSSKIATQDAKALCSTNLFRGTHLVFSERLSKEYIKDRFSDWLDEKVDEGEFSQNTASEKHTKFKEQVDGEYFERIEDVIDEYEDFFFDGYFIKFNFDDFDPYELSQQYLDCVDAIKWGIGKYDEYKKGRK